MVAFDGRIKNSWVKTHLINSASTPNVSPPNNSCDSANETSTKILLSPVHKSKQTRLLIKTDMSVPQKIGLNLNTSVHLKQKTRYNLVHLFNELVILILCVFGIFCYLEIQRLKEDVEILKLQMRAVEDPIKLNLEVMNTLIKSIEQNKEDIIEENEMSRHSVEKREAESAEDGRPCSNCSSIWRMARSVSRGPLALHLRGALPEITVRDGGVISPWYVDKSSSGGFLLADGIVGERKGVLEVVEEGLYYIYAQIYYLTSSSLNSYAISVQLGDSRGQREDTVISVCSAEAAVTKMSELSCFTSTVRYLRRGDRLYVTQRERNRRIIFRDNQSFLGLVLLNSHHVNN